MDSGKTQDLELTRISFSRDHYHLQKEMVSWCEDHFGPGHWNRGLGGNKWSIESMFGYTHFYFLNTEDALMFTLKWR